MGNDLMSAAGLIHIIEESRQNALKKVNEELIKMYWKVGEFLSKETEHASYGDAYIDLVSKKFVSFKKPMNPSKFQTHPAVLELFALCAIPAVSLKGRKNTSANNA